MDKDGYPEQSELDRIEKWDHREGWPAFMEYVESLWKYPEYFESFNDGHRRVWRIHTGGWSGNEDIINAMNRNRLFWSFCWKSSRRGGHYEFEIKAK